MAQVVRDVVIRVRIEAPGMAGAGAVAGAPRVVGAPGVAAAGAGGAAAAMAGKFSTTGRVGPSLVGGAAGMAGATAAGAGSLGAAATALMAAASALTASAGAIGGTGTIGGAISRGGGAIPRVDPVTGALIAAHRPALGMYGGGGPVGPRGRMTGIQPGTAAYMAGIAPSVMAARAASVGMYGGGGPVGPPGAMTGVYGSAAAYMGYEAGRVPVPGEPRRPRGLFEAISAFTANQGRGSSGMSLRGSTGMRAVGAFGMEMARLLTWSRLVTRLTYGLQEESLAGAGLTGAGVVGTGVAGAAGLLGYLELARGTTQLGMPRMFGGGGLFQGPTPSALRTPAGRAGFLDQLVGGVGQTRQARLVETENVAVRRRMATLAETQATGVQGGAAAVGALGDIASSRISAQLALGEVDRTSSAELAGLFDTAIGNLQTRRSAAQAKLEAARTQFGGDRPRRSILTGRAVGHSLVTGFGAGLNPKKPQLTAGPTYLGVDIDALLTEEQARSNQLSLNYRQRIGTLRGEVEGYTTQIQAVREQQVQFTHAAVMEQRRVSAQNIDAISRDIEQATTRQLRLEGTARSAAFGIAGMHPTTRRAGLGALQQVLSTGQPVSGVRQRQLEEIAGLLSPGMQEKVFGIYQKAFPDQMRQLGWPGDIKAGQGALAQLEKDKATLEAEAKKDAAELYALFMSAFKAYMSQKAAEEKVAEEGIRTQRGQAGVGTATTGT